MRGKKRKIQLSLIFNCIFVFIVFISPFALWSAEIIERGDNYSNSDRIDSSVADLNVIVILGSGFTNDPELTPTAKLSNSVLARMTEGVRLYNKLDSAYFLTSGAAVNSSITQAQAVAEAAIALGVSPTDTIHLSDTFKTEDEARSCRAKLNELKTLYPNQPFNVFLVTSAIHMPRAVYWFSKYGIPVTPVPCDYLVKEDPLFPKSGWIPSWRKMDILNSVIYESMGMFYARYLSD